VSSGTPAQSAPATSPGQGENPVPRRDTRADEVDLRDESLDAIPRPFWRSFAQSFQAAFGPHAKEILADVPNYTDVKPSMQISEVRLRQG
jgi:hypothetical protein